MFLVAPTVGAQDTVDLNVDFEKGTQTRITCDLSHSGIVIVRDEAQDITQSLPLDVDAKLSFFQLVNGTNQAIRFYESASAKIKIQKGTSTPKLSSANQLIVARLKSDEGELVDLASMSGTLEQPELELLQNPADPLTLAAVFRKKGAKEGDQWKPANTALAKLLRVQKITESNVQLKLKSIDKGLARVYIIGTLTADVADVVTKMEVSGIAMIDSAANKLLSFKLGIRETRGPGQISPGFEGETKVELRIGDETTPRLSVDSLRRYTRNRKIRQRIKWESPENFIVNYEPRWKMITAESEAAVLRYIDKNELLAQCSIVQLPSRPVDQPLSLEVYKKEVAKIVAADENARLVSAAKVPMASENMVLRVVVASEEEGLPVNWFYYHVSCKDGRQVTFVFTLAASVSARVSSIATRLVNDFEFLPQPKKVASAKSSGPSSKNNARQPATKR